MTVYFLKVTITPTWKSHTHDIRVEYYGKVEFYFNDIDILTKEELDMYGFKSIKAAENTKKNKEAIYKRDEEKFGTFLHTIEIVKRSIDT